MRSVQHGREYELQLAHIESSARRADELTDGLVWLLSRDPEEAGAPVSPDDPIWMAITRHNVPGMHQLAIYYMFDDSHVWLLGVRKVDP